MFNCKVELGEADGPTLYLMDCMTGNVCVEAFRREHVQDVLVVCEEGELIAGRQNVGKADNAFNNSV